MLDGDDPVGVARDGPEPRRMDGTDRGRLRGRRGVCFTTGIDPGFANDLFPMTLMGLCGEVKSVRASRTLDYTDYAGDYEKEMGIGRPPEFKAMLEIPDILVMAWGATVPMIAQCGGHRARRDHHHVGKWVTDVPQEQRQGCDRTR